MVGMDSIAPTPSALKFLQGAKPRSLTEAERMHLLEEIDVTEAIEFFRRRQRKRAANSCLRLVDGSRTDQTR